MFEGYSAKMCGLKNSAHVDGGPRGVTHMGRNDSEEPHRRKRNFSGPKFLKNDNSKMKDVSNI